ncbi:MAG: hypothetical protein QOI36_2378, partial [Pseudonocardiales bacterium]|nr:hypothetical protein [Pseudonocardiales bacterium]
DLCRTSSDLGLPSVVGLAEFAKQVLETGRSDRSRDRLAQDRDDAADK